MALSLAFWTPTTLKGLRSKILELEHEVRRLQPSRDVRSQLKARPMNEYWAMRTHMIILCEDITDLRAVYKAAKRTRSGASWT